MKIFDNTNKVWTYSEEILKTTIILLNDYKIIFTLSFLDIFILLNFIIILFIKIKAGLYRYMYKPAFIILGYLLLDDHTLNFKVSIRRYKF